jgi:hypothetical protein
MTSPQVSAGRAICLMCIRIASLFAAMQMFLISGCLVLCSDRTLRVEKWDSRAVARPCASGGCCSLAAVVAPCSLQQPPAGATWWSAVFMFVEGEEFVQ